MAREWLEREDLSVFVVAGVPRSFNKQLKAMLHEKQGDRVESLRLEDDLADWVLARVRGEMRTGPQRTPASMALWRAFRALAAARYHLRGDPEMDREIRRIREEVERLWFLHSPMHEDGVEKVG